MRPAGALDGNEHLPLFRFRQRRQVGQGRVGRRRHDIHPLLAAHDDSCSCSARNSRITSAARC